MLVAKRWKEIEHDPDRSLRQVLKALTTRPGKPKGFDYGNFIADKIFRQMLREPWKQWTNEEREQLRTDPAAQALYQDSMNKLRKEMRRGHEGFTKEEIRQGLQQARDRYHLRLRTQQEAL